MMNVNISILALPHTVRLLLSKFMDIVPESKGCEEAVLVSVGPSG
jgi:hypothetical protein